MLVLQQQELKCPATKPKRSSARLHPGSPVTFNPFPRWMSSAPFAQYWRECRRMSLRLGPPTQLEFAGRPPLGCGDDSPCVERCTGFKIARSMLPECASRSPTVSMFPSKPAPVRTVATCARGVFTRFDAFHSLRVTHTCLRCKIAGRKNSSEMLRAPAGGGPQKVWNNDIHLF